MNFVETAPVTAPRLAEELSETTTPATTAAPCQKKAFGVSFGLTLAVFSFTLLGMITASNAVVDGVVIPKLYDQTRAELMQPTLPLTTDTEAAVETTLAR